MEAFFSSPILTNILLIFILLSALLIAFLLAVLQQEVNDGRYEYLEQLRKRLPIKGEWNL